MIDLVKVRGFERAHPMGATVEPGAEEDHLPDRVAERGGQLRIDGERAEHEEVDVRGDVFAQARRQRRNPGSQPGEHARPTRGEQRAGGLVVKPRRRRHSPITERAEKRDIRGRAAGPVSVHE